MTARAIETRYAGCRFRSRLEARWAVFFDQADIPWEYEPEGFIVGPDQRPYLPDFRLPDCGTWVEVKGAAEQLDFPLLEAAALELPGDHGRGEAGPRLMVLGSIPEPSRGDFGWLSLSSSWPEGGVDYRRFGFGSYHKNYRPWLLLNDEPIGAGCGWLIPTVDPYETNQHVAAYQAARTARFEHGERPRPR